MEITTEMAVAVREIWNLPNGTPVDEEDWRAAIEESKAAISSLRKELEKVEITLEELRRKAAGFAAQLSAEQDLLGRLKRNR
jgi:multidrug resistance efflux pump